MDELVGRIDDGEIDTVVVAFTDMQGRLQGKRLHGRYFADDVVDHGTEGCNYLLAVDVDMNTVDGYAISSWERGYGDMEFVLDERTIRRAHPPAGDRDGPVRPGLARPLPRRPVAADDPPAPARPAAPSRAGPALAGTELEFIAFDTTYEAAADAALPRPDAGQPVQRRLLDPRHQPGRAAAARDPQHDVRRRAGRRGRQGRVQLRPARDRLPLRRRADHRRQPRRLQDRRQGDRRPAGQVDHLHGEVQRARGQLLPHPPVAARRGRRRWCSGTRTQGPRRRSTTTSSPACWPRPPTSRCSTRRTSTPTSGSPPARSRRPTIAWGLDNRTCAVRLVGHGAGARMENRVPGADVNPYLALAAMLAGGLHGIEHELPLEDELVGNAYDSDKPQVPHTMAEARERFAVVRAGPRGLRRRGRRPLRQHGRRRAGGVRRRGHRLGAAPRIRAAVSTDTSPSSTRPPSSRSSTSRSTDLAGTDAAIERVARGVPGLARRGARASGPRCCAGSPRSSTRTSTSSPSSRCATPATPGATPAGRPATSATASTTTPGRRSGCSAGRSRSPAAPTSPSTSRSASSAIIVPWNFPMPIAGWGFAPALAAGNTVVLKPAELTPLTAIRLGELALEAGLPEHVLTVLPGKGSVVGERFVTHELVRKVCFTGSTEVGKRIMAGCAEQVKRVTLELGGKSSNIVFADADIAAAAACAPYAVFDNAGQDCCARSRILVERSAYDEFLAGLEPAVAGAAGARPGRRVQRDGPADLVGPAGARCRATSTRSRSPSPARAPDGDGCWVPPSVVTVDDPATRIWREEVFGPVVAVMPFDDEADAVAQGQRHRVRPVRLDLHQRPRPRAPGRPRRRGRQPQRQLALVGPLLDAVRRLQAVRPRPRARSGRPDGVHRGEERLHRPLTGG